MVDRIRTLLASRQLSPTQFADAIGVARPIVSHILSGRNKPSLEVVQRILSAMPELSMPWLLNGTGAMLAAGLPATALPAVFAQEPSTAREASEPPVLLDAVRTPPRAAQNGTFDSSRPARSVAMPGPASRPPSSKQPVAAAKQPQRFAHKPVVAAPSPSGNAVGTVLRSEPPAEPETVSDAPKEETGYPASPPPRSGRPAPDLIAGGEKTVRRIVVFYHDGSFTDYRPE